MSQSVINVDGETFEIKDAGGGGDCLFKSIALALNKRSHHGVRQEIVEHVIQRWPEYQFWVKYGLDISTKHKYRSKMGRSGEYGSVVECRAASQHYKINVIIVRILPDGTYFKDENLLESPNHPFIHLLFTGQHNERHRDGHFQLLAKVDRDIYHESIANNKFSDSNRTESAEIELHQTDCTNALASISNFDEPNEAVANEYEMSLEGTPANDSGESTHSMEMSTSEENYDTTSEDNFICNDAKVKERNQAKRSTEKNRTGALSVRIKQMIYKVRSYFQTEKMRGHVLNIRNVTQRTASCLGISKNSVKRVTKEGKSGEWKEPYEGTPGRPSVEFDEFLIGIIRRKIMDFYMRKEYPTVQNLLKQLRQDVEDLPEFCENTLRKQLKEMKFTYKRLNKKPVLMESQVIAGKRSEFLRLILYYRRNDWKIYYTDETWSGANQSRTHSWVECVAPDNYHENFDEYRSGVQQVMGFRGGFITPSGSGRRVIILHIGSREGFVDGCMKCFIGKKGSMDYHDEMNAEHYEEWFRHVLTVLPEKSVIVIDQAPYHTMLDPDYRNPTAAWRKEQIIEWMIRRNVPLPEYATSFDALTKANLLVQARAYHFPKKYLLEKITEELRGDSVKLLWLPVAHCEFNAIELIWAYVKNKVATQNKTFKINDVHRLCVDIMNDIPSDLWQKCVAHAEKIQETYINSESRMAAAMEPMIIHANEDTDSESDVEFETDEEIV